MFELSVWLKYHEAKVEMSTSEPWTVELQQKGCEGTLIFFCDSQEAAQALAAGFEAATGATVKEVR